MQVIRGVQPGTLKVVVYGPEGIGKTTFASQFPDPLFIDTEDGTRHMDVARTPKPTSWPFLMSLVKEVQQDPTLCRTLVLDTADWAEQLCIKHICDSNDKKGIEDFGYGKGYTYVYEEFGKLLNELTRVKEQGIHVVVTAHAKMRKFEQPDEMGAYDRWEMKLTKQTPSIVKEWADMVLFANYKTLVVNVDGKGSQKGKNKAQGGKRVMYTSHNPCWDAKNRHGLAPELPFQYAEIEGIISAALNPQTMPVQKPETKPESPVNVPFGNTPSVAAPTSSPEPSPEPEEPEPQKAPKQNDYSGDLVPEISEGIPQALKDLMIANDVTETDIRMAVSAAGYFPLDIPVTKYPADFIDGCLISAWDAVYEKILEERENFPF